MMTTKLTMFTPEIEISNCAKICYATTAEKDITTQLVHSNSHLAALRFAYATVYIEGISVACQNQIVRSKHLDFMVQSKRYVNPDKGEFEFIMPENLEGEYPDVMQDHFDSTLALYKQLVANGVKKEDARAVLPANTSTKMYITGNLQAWHSFFTLRLTNHAQLEVRAVANSTYDLLAEVFPQVFTTEMKLTLQKGH
jgi:thymidylate synthase (FAD)